MTTSLYRWTVLQQNTHAQQNTAVTEERDPARGLDPPLEAGCSQPPLHVGRWDIFRCDQLMWVQVFVYQTKPAPSVEHELKPDTTGS